jgi:hypothetical protein
MNDGGFGGAGGASGLGGADGAGGGGGGEDIGVAQEADSPCCCSISVSGTMNCSLQASCGPYTTSSDPALCSDGSAGTGNGGCSASGLRSDAGGGVEVIVLFLALAAYRTMLRRLARG